MTSTLPNLHGVTFYQPAAPTTHYQNTISTTRIQHYYTYTVYVRLAPAIARAAAKPAAPVHHEDILRYAPATVKGTTLTKVGNTMSLKYAPAEKFDFSGALSSANDYYDVGKTGGAGVGCVTGAGIVSLSLGPEMAEGGCILGTPVGIVVGGVVLGLVGFIEGGYNLPHANTFGH